ncbi:YbjN domain-containing protein [Allobaculum sp. Allo2]|uniref:YbjN domain-containing protein n=1 Tax=Allobaculum sp. Allo2 TaxID=2853432 RepID=UPI001F62238A|nr:YbjN domain-containing protein [Allobaculum sp. Allo2]UNT92943.1 YbjN domain-containing protein [Allobaculum sp. Allo2]
MHYDYAEETHKWVLDAFEEIGIHKFDDTNDGLIRFSMLVPKSKFRAYDFAIRLCDHTLTMYMIAPFRGDDSDRKMMTKLAVLQTNANYGLRNGNFEMDLRDGEIRYKTYINLENSTVNPDVLDDAIHMSIAAFDVYGKDMAKIVYGFGQESEDEELDDEKTKRNPFPSTAIPRSAGCARKSSRRSRCSRQKTSLNIFISSLAANPRRGNRGPGNRHRSGCGNTRSAPYKDSGNDHGHASRVQRGVRGRIG